MNTYKPVSIRVPSVRQRLISNGGSAPKPPGFIAFISKGAIKGRRPTATPPRKPDMALRSRPRVALSSVSVKQFYFIIDLFLLTRCISHFVLDIGYTLKKEVKKIDFREIESVSLFADKDPDEDSRQLEELLEICELEVLPKEEAGVFRNAITRLFYSRQFRVGNAVLPEAVIRSHLWSLNGLILLDAREKLRRNTDKEIRNSTAYIMVVIMNNIWEYTGDVMVDPELNAMNSS